MFFFLFPECWGNLPPVFSMDMNNQALYESTSVGEVVYRLEGYDPEGSPVRYGLVGTDRFSVNPITGEVTIAKPLDREVNDTLRFLVTLEDVTNGTGNNNIVQVPISVIILDDNDNAPVFKNVPYESTVPEDTPVGSTVFKGILVHDPDSVGETIEVKCINQPQVEKNVKIFIYRPYSFFIKVDNFSPTITATQYVCALGTSGTIERSAILNPSIPWTFPLEFVTESDLDFPILQDPT